MIEHTFQRIEDPGHSFDHEDKIRYYQEVLCSRASIREHYVNGVGRLHLHLETVPVPEFPGLHLGNLCAVFQRAFQEVEGAGRDLVGHMSGINHNGDTCCRNDLDEPMFIGAVDLMKNPKGVVSSTIPSLVRLLPLDKCNMVRMNALELPPCALAVKVRKEVAASILLRGGAANEDGELSTVGGLVGVEQCQLPSEPIKRRAEMVYELTDEDSRDGMGLLLESYAAFLLPRLRISLYGNEVRVDLLDTLDLCVKSVELIVSNLYLESWTEKRVHGLEYLNAKNTEDTEDTTGPGHPDSQAQGRDGRSAQGGEVEQGFTSQEQPEEEVIRTSTSHHSGDCTAKHTRSDRSQDA